jgi:hypothetical protein
MVEPQVGIGDSMEAPAAEPFVLWCMRREHHLLEADLVSENDRSSLQVFLDDRLTATASFSTRSRALECSRRLRRWWERRGWTVVGSAEFPGEQDDSHD